MKLQELLHKKSGVLFEAKDASALDTKRKPLTKIHQLTGTPLRQFLDDFKNGLNSASFEIKVTPKIDGHPFRVAWIDGEVFVETGYSGLMGKNELASSTAGPHVKRFFSCIEKQDTKPLFNELKKYGLSGVKIMGELLANAEEFQDNGKITYVGTTYDATKLGKYGSVVMIEIKGADMDGLIDLDDATADKLKTFLATKFSNSDVSYFDINKFAQKIPIRKRDFPRDLIEQIDSISDPYKLKKAEAEALKMEINDALTTLFKEKFSNPDIMPEGDQSLEGIAFDLNGNLYGIHYQSWKDIRHSYYEDIDEIRDFLQIFLAKMVDKPATTPLGSLVSKIRANIDEYQPMWKKSWKDFLKRKNELIAKITNNKTLPKFVQQVGQHKIKELLSKFKDEDINSDLNSLLDAIMPIQNMEGKTVAIIPGSFKPPHKGHFEMIKHYSEIADDVYVLISEQRSLSSRRLDKFGRAISSDVAKQILKIYCNAYGLDNVIIETVPNLMRWIAWKLHSITNAKVILGVSQKDDTARFDYFTSPKFKNKVPTIEILPVEDYMPKSIAMDGKDVSATWVRQNIDNKKVIRKMVPDKLNDKDIERVYKLLNPANESREQISEGGNAIPGVKRINQENVEATLDNIKKTLLSKLDIDPKYTTVLGSTGKRLPGNSSGDIDLMIDKKQLNGGDFQTFAKTITNVLDTIEGAEYKVMPGLGIVSTRWPISNTDGKQEGEFVQLDLMLSDNFEFMKFSQSSPKEVEGETYYKMTIRNAIFSAIARVMDTVVNKTGIVYGMDDKEHAVDVVRNSYSITTGLNKVHKIRKQKKDGTYNKTWTELERENISLDPQEIVDILFGRGHTLKDVETSMGAWEVAMSSPALSDKTKKKLFLKTLKDELDRKVESQKIELPKEIKSALATVSKDTHLLDEAANEDELDTTTRVAVIITDGKLVLTGQSPQSAKTNGKYDLFKGHAKIGENLREAACREVREECGLNLSESNLEQISGPIKYLSGTTITFFLYKVDKLPSLSSLTCNSFFEYKGREIPEIVAYHAVPLEDLESYLYASLVSAINRGGIKAKLMELTESKELSISKLSSMIVESIINHKHNKKR